MTINAPRVITRNTYDFKRLARADDSITFAAGTFVYNALAASAYTYAKRHGNWRCSLETLPDGSVRVWRDRTARETATDRRAKDLQDQTAQDTARLVAHVTRNPGQTPEAIERALDLDLARYTRAITPLLSEGVLRFAANRTLVLA